MIRNIFIDDNQEFKIQEIVENSKENPSFQSVKIEIRKVDNKDDLERIMKYVTEQVISDFQMMKSNNV